jgi:hypothetical protein
MLIEGDETGAFHFELMTAFIYQDRLSFKGAKGAHQASGGYTVVVSGLWGYILVAATGMLRKSG